MISIPCKEVALSHMTDSHRWRVAFSQVGVASQQVRSSMFLHIVHTPLSSLEPRLGWETPLGATAMGKE